MLIYIYSIIVTIILIISLLFLHRNRIERKEKGIIEQK